MNGWHSQARVRGPAPDAEQVALQLCRGWLCQPAHPLGQASSPRAACWDPRLGGPLGRHLLPGNGAMEVLPQTSWGSG